MNELESLLDKSLEILRREITNLHIESSGKKLSPSSARDLVSYVKLLSDVLDRQAEEGKDLSKLSEEELRQKAQELLSEASSRPNSK